MKARRQRHYVARKLSEVWTLSSIRDCLRQLCRNARAQINPKVDTVGIDANTKAMTIATMTVIMPLMVTRQKGMRAVREQPADIIVMTLG